MANQRLRSAIPWLLGCVLVANVYLVPGRDDSPRAMDLLAVPLLAWMLWRLARRGLPSASLAAIACLALMPAAWFAIALTSGARATLLLAARWLLAIPWGFALVAAADAPAGRRRLAWGLWCGLVLNAAVLAWQWFGGLDQTRALGLAANDSVLSDLDEILRYPGLHGHANASSAVASLIAPVGLYLYFQCRARLWVPVASLLLLLASSHITSSRSPLIIGGVMSVLLILAARQPRQALRLTTALTILVVPVFIWLGPPGGQIRWEDVGNISVNGAERLASNRLALGLIGERPLGAGVERVATDISDRLDNPSTHNALLELSADFGVPMALAIVLCFLWLATRLMGAPSPRLLEAALALQVLGLFFFEEHGNNPTFMALTTWLVAAAPLGRGWPGVPAVTPTAVAPAAAAVGGGPDELPAPAGGTRA